MNEPLAERIRPKTLEDYISQQHLVGKNGILTQHIKQGIIPSLILWGPPGIGKTTLANIIANVSGRPFYTLSAISSGVKDVRDVIEKAKKSGGLFTAKNPILFIDEIHRFSKSQQDSLLGAVEKGWITLIGATTENPSFEVIPALLSRCQVYILNSFDKNDLVALLHRAMEKDEILATKKIIGQHVGLSFYTRGQSKSLLIGGLRDFPEGKWYVVEKDFENNDLLVSQDENFLMENCLETSNMHWILGTSPSKNFRALVKTRYRDAGVMANVSVLETGNIRVEFDALVRAITPGQSAVLYVEDVCLGGGAIK